MNIKTEIKQEIEALISPLSERIELLEEEVFRKQPPRGGIVVRLNKLEERINSLKEEVQRGIETLDQKHSRKLTEAIEVLAELRSVVEEIQKEIRRGGDMVEVLA